MKLGVCVPYRNREQHLQAFVPKVAQYLRNHGIDDFCMYFGHQCDDKLFNRGAMKNVAAKVAFEDGCDYIVWHDIDMLPEEGGGADYSFPEKMPRHIATAISQVDYKLKCFEYFGGAVVFSKEQVEKTNGYSNEYWDWGSEDDDLFWRCYLEGMVEQESYAEMKDQGYVHFSGDNSYIKIPAECRELRNFTAGSHTISVLCRVFQQPEKHNVYLIGDKNRRYLEYPIFILPGYDYGFSFNNSRAMSLQFWNTFNQHNYMWIKRYDQQWSWLTAAFDSVEQTVRFYLNGQEMDPNIDNGSVSPLKWFGRLKPYGTTPIYLGMTPSVPREDLRRFMKGDIAKVQMWRRTLSSNEIQNLPYKTPDDLALNLDFGNNTQDTYIEEHEVEHCREDFTIYNSILPHRVPGRFLCLYHQDEGIVGGKFVKGEPSARNEERYVLGMQQGKIAYKNDGIAQLKYNLLGIDQLTPFAKMINVTL